MLSRTAVAMSARADFVVETAVNLRIRMLAISLCDLQAGGLRTLSCSVPKMEAR